MESGLRTGLAVICLAALAAGAFLGRLADSRESEPVLPEVVVAAEAPVHLRGVMPEVVVRADAPDDLRGMMPEVLAEARCPAGILEEVVVSARREPAGTATVQAFEAADIGQRTSAN